MSLIHSSSFANSIIEDDRDHDRWHSMLRHLLHPLQDEHTIATTNQNDTNQLTLESIMEEAYMTYERLDLQQHAAGDQSPCSFEDADDMMNHDTTASNNLSSDIDHTTAPCTNVVDSESQQNCVMGEELSSITSIASQIEYILQQFYVGCRNPHLPVRDRRKAFVALQKLLQNLQHYIHIHHQCNIIQNNNDCHNVELSITATTTSITTNEQPSASNASMIDEEEGQTVVSTTLPHASIETSTIYADKSIIHSQATTTHPMKHGNGVANDMSNSKLLHDQHQISPQVNDTFETTHTSCEMTTQKCPTSDELLKAIFSGASFGPEAVDVCIPFVPQLNKESTGVSQPCDLSSATATFADRMVPDTFVTASAVPLSVKNATMTDHVAHSKGQTTRLDGSAVVEDTVTGNTLTTSIVPLFPTNRVKSRENLELPFVQHPLLLNNNILADNMNDVDNDDSEGEIRDESTRENDDDKDKDQDHDLTNNINVSKNDDKRTDSPRPDDGVDDDVDDDDEEYVPDHKNKKVSTSRAARATIPEEHIDRSRGTGMHPCMSKTLANVWDLSSSREFLEPFNSEKILVHGSPKGRYIRCHLCSVILLYKMNKVKKHCQSATHEQKLYSHLKSVLASLKKKRARSNDQVTSQNSPKRPAIGNEDHIYGPAVTQTMIPSVNSFPSTEERMEGSTNDVNGDDNEIMIDNDADEVDDNSMSISEGSNHDRPLSNILGIIDSKLLAKQIQVLTKSSASLPCLPRKEANHWGRLVTVSRKYLKLYTPFQSTERLLLCEVCSISLPYDMELVYDHCIGQNHQIKLKLELNSTTGNNMAYNPSKKPLASVSPPPPPPPQISGNHPNYNIHSNQPEFNTRFAPPAAATHKQTDYHPDHTTHSNQVGFNPRRGRQSSGYKYQSEITDFFPGADADVSPIIDVGENVVVLPIVTPATDKVSQVSSSTVQCISVIALADKAPTIACTVEERGMTLVTFNESINCVDSLSLQNRLEEWDPFWWNEAVTDIKTTGSVAYTMPTTNLIKTAVSFVLNTEMYCSHIDSWGNEISNQQRYSLLLRMFPLDNSHTNRTRADDHIWPKGTFIQLSNNRPILIEQRKQRKHDLNEWCFMCKELSLAPLIADPKIPTQVHIFCYDDQRYISCVSLSRYRPVDEVLRSLLDKNNPKKLHEVSYTEGLQRAIAFAASLVSIDIDGDDDDETDAIGKFIVSLRCPLSRTIMEIPVRGKACLHHQCFDLRNYLSMNTFRTGNRWRCAVCESFISVSNLQICTFTQHLIQEFRSKVAWNRDRVQLCSDGSYELLETRKIRRQKIAVAPWIAIKLENTSSVASNGIDDMVLVDVD